MPDRITELVEGLIDMMVTHGQEPGSIVMSADLLRVWQGGKLVRGGLYRGIRVEEATPWFHGFVSVYPALSADYLKSLLSIEFND